MQCSIIEQTCNETMRHNKIPAESTLASSCVYYSSRLETKIIRNILVMGGHDNIKKGDVKKLQPVSKADTTTRACPQQ